MDKINTSPSVQIGKRGVDMRGMSAGFGGRVRAGCVERVLGAGKRVWGPARGGRADFGGRVRRDVSGARRVGVGCGEESMGSGTGEGVRTGGGK